MRTKEQNGRGGRNKAVGGKCGRQINPSQCFGPVGDLALSLTPLGFFGPRRPGGVELSVSRVDARLGATGSRGADTLELQLQPVQRGAHVLGGPLPPPRVPPPPRRPRELLRRCHLGPPVPACCS